MYLPSLASAPTHALPTGYTTRTYRKDGGADAARYRFMWQEANRRLYNDVTLQIPADWFYRSFGANEDEHEQRIIFVVDRGNPVGAITAWYYQDACGTMGQVHNVCMLPSYTGQGLSKPLLSVVLRRQAELGHTECRLSTTTRKLEAINLYAKFGFLPLLPEEPAQRPAAYRVWRELQPHLREPFAQTFGTEPLWSAQLPFSHRQRIGIGRHLVPAANLRRQSTTAIEPAACSLARGCGHPRHSML